MRGAENGILADYATTYHYYFVIDGNGTIAWRGDWNDAVIRQVIDEALAPLPGRGATWSGLRARYR